MTFGSNVQHGAEEEKASDQSEEEEVHCCSSFLSLASSGIDKHIHRDDDGLEETIESEYVGCQKHASQ